MTIAKGDHLLLARNGKVVEGEGYHDYEVIAVDHDGPYCDAQGNILDPVEMSKPDWWKTHQMGKDFWKVYDKIKLRVVE